jgi:hypothetical protein
MSFKPNMKHHYPFGPAKALDVDITSANVEVKLSV